MKLSTNHVVLLQLASLRQLPSTITETGQYAISDVRELIELGLLEAKDASADCGDCFLEPRITAWGSAALRELTA